MSNLQVLENGLVPVYQGTNGKAVNARELHEFLEVGTKFTDWIKERIQKYGFVENEDYITASEKKETANGGYTLTTEYILAIDTAKEISMVQNNEKGSQARKYFIAVEKKFKEIAKPQSIEDLIILQANSVKELKNAVESIKKDGEETKQDLQGIRDVITLNILSWRKDTASLISKIALNLGGYEHIKTIREESYKLLELRVGVSLSIRLTNKRRRMADEGICKSKRDKLTNVDIISDDKKLVEVYVAIIKEMAIKNKVVIGGQVWIRK